MNQFLEQFRDLSTEYLLERRALGPNALVPNAHAAIEQILRERNVQIPPMPSRAISSDSSESEPRRSRIAIAIVFAVVTVIGAALAKQFSATWIGLLFTVGLGIFWVADWFRRQKLSDSERTSEDEAKHAERDGLTDLMRSSAAGDLARVQELIDYRVNVNAVSGIGSTALMYAAKNGHDTVVDRLLQAGADPSLRTKKGSSAADLARNAGHNRTVQILLSNRAQ